MSTHSTAGRFREIRVFNHESASCWRIDEVDFCPVKVRIKFSLRCEHYVIESIFRIDGGIERRVEVEGVLHSAASAAEDTDPQKRIIPQILRLFDPFDFIYRYRSY